MPGESNREHLEMATNLYLRFTDLKARGIVRNWATLQNWIKHLDFPAGRLVSPNARMWTEREVEGWIAKRPVARKKVPMPKGRRPKKKAA
jgi:predicted DNA-binding transcriptional regulator AlpA